MLLKLKTSLKIWHFFAQYTCTKACKQKANKQKIKARKTKAYTCTSDVSSNSLRSFYYLAYASSESLYYRNFRRLKTGNLLIYIYK